MPATLPLLLIDSNTLLFFFRSLARLVSLRPLCISRLNWHTVRFYPAISFNSEGNYVAGLIADNSASCQRTSPMVTLGHDEMH